VRTGPSGDLRPGRPRSKSWLRTARLNAVGWGALAVACVIAGLVTDVVLLVTGWPVPLRAGIGPVIVVLGLVVADRRKWARMETTFSFTDDVLAMRAVADELVARGLPVTLDVESWGARLRYRNRDAKRVHAALADLGITNY
jgi:hypothetical protein